MGITLKGASNGGQGGKPKLKWDLAWKISAYKRCKIDKMSAKDAIEAVATEFGFGDRLPASYSEHAYSHMNRFMKELQKKIEKNDTATIQALRDAGLIQEEASAPSVDEVTEDEFSDEEVLTGEES